MKRLFVLMLLGIALATLSLACKKAEEPAAPAEEAVEEAAEEAAE